MLYGSQMKYISKVSQHHKNFPNKVRNNSFLQKAYNK